MTKDEAQAELEAATAAVGAAARLIRGHRAMIERVIGELRALEASRIALRRAG